MGLFDELKKLTRPYDSEEYDFIDEAESAKPAPAGQGRSNPFSGFTGSQGPAARTSSAAVMSSAPASAPVRHASAARAQKREGRVVSIPGTSGTQTQMILVKPELFENARAIADQLRDRHPIVLNLETTPKDVSRRLLDFLSGVAYAQDGKIQQIASNTYIIMPYNVDLTGDFAGDFAGNLESGGAYL